MTRKLSAHGRKLDTARSRPVGRALARKAIADAIAEMRKHLTRVSVKAYLTADSEPAPALLGDLALMLGVGAEIGMHRVPDAPETRKMHAALRTVLGMGCNGWRWRASQAKILHEAAEMAMTAFEACPALGITMFPGACELAHEIRLGTARMDAVVGAEVYAKQPVCAQQAGANSY
jgi:hypothetical protein